MDGSGQYQIVTGLKYPCGIVIDFQMSRMYWTDCLLQKIQSIKINGGDVDTIVEGLPGPRGIALIGENMFFGNLYNNALQSITIEGTNNRTHHTDSHGIWYLTVVPDMERPTNRTNHCKGQHCTGICVLTTTSSRCIN